MGGRKLARLLLILATTAFTDGWKEIEDKSKCPEVRAVINFDLNQFLGSWFVVEYYASAEEALPYSCMRAVFREDVNRDATSGTWFSRATMNFTYSFADDPTGARLFGNITWRVDEAAPAHWMHAEDTYEGVYNTYILDTEYKTWALLLHCAEKLGTPRYLSAFILSRNTSLSNNVISYLRDKLPRYDIDSRFVFPVLHDNCQGNETLIDSPLLMTLGAKTLEETAFKRNYSQGFGYQVQEESEEAKSREILADDSSVFGI